MATKDVSVRLLAITNQYKAAMADASRSTQAVASATQTSTGKMNSAWSGVGGSIGGTAKMMGIFAAGGAAYQALTGSIDQASKLEESTNAVRVSFGAAADSVLAIGENSATSFGLAKSEFNDLAVRFSGFAQTIASGTGQEVSEVVQEMTGRVADFASVMNIDVPRAAEVMMSTLSGETEPIRRYGIDVSAAAVETFLLAEGLVESKGAITEADKQLGRYLLTMQETDKVAGDFANTSDSYANAMRVASANIKDLQASIGSLLLPVIAEATTDFNTLIAVINEIPKKIGLDIDFGGAGGLRSFLGSPGFIDDMGEDKLLGWLGLGDKSNAGPKGSNNEDLRRREQAAAAAAAAIEEVTDAEAAYQRELDNAARTGIMAGEALGRRNERLEEAAEIALEKARAAEERWIESVNRSVDAVIRSMEAEEDRSNARRAAADAVFALHDAEDRLAEQSEKFAEILENEESTLADVRQGMDDAAEAAAGLADAQVRIADETARADGKTLSLNNANRIWTDSMLTSAATLKGPLRQAVLDHIARVNGVPAERMTAFTAAVDNGSIRTAEDAFRWLARPRSVWFSARGPGWDARQEGVAVPLASGTNYHLGGLALVGEEGPELVNLPRGSRVHTASDTAAMLSSPYSSAMTAGGTSTMTVVQHIHAAPGMNEDALARATVNRLRRFERHNGPGWRAAS
jgi:hypothetical protein